MLYNLYLNLEACTLATSFFCMIFDRSTMHYLFPSFLIIVMILFFHQEMEAYIRGLIPNLAQLRDMPSGFVNMYCRIAAQKFFFFCDPHRRGMPKLQNIKYKPLHSLPTGFGLDALTLEKTRFKILYLIVEKN